MSNQLTACFNGCSFTWGEGFPEKDRELYIYDRVVARNLGYKRVNIAERGSSNHRIFIRSVNAIEQGMCDVLFVQWSALNRIWLSPGPCAWYCTNPAPEISKYQYRDIILEGQKKLEFELTLRMLNHDFNNILELIDYCNILSTLAQQKNMRVVFINGLIPWTDDVIKPLSGDLGSSFSSYTKEILDFNNRNDNELEEYFSILQEKFSTLDQSKWVNIFDSFFSSSVDQGPEGHHPGILSHQQMADKVINYMRTNAQ
jgi:hypothetical protein